jgi:hypothetical protein
MLLMLAIILALSTGASPAEPQKAPAQFKKEGAFTGGSKQDGIYLTGIRFGQHPDFLRIVLDFSVMKDGKYVGAPTHPPYRIEYGKYPYRFKVTLEGVKYAETATIENQYAVPLSIVTSAENTVQLIEFFVSRPALFKVIEIDDPAKLSLDVKYTATEPIPTVWAVQLQDVPDVETAFRLLNEFDFPEGYEPDLIVLGNSIFVEDAYLSLEAAAAMVAKLEAAGLPAMVTERGGNELPRL